jgi:TolB-like protein
MPPQGAAAAVGAGILGGLLGGGDKENKKAPAAVASPERSTGTAAGPDVSTAAAPAEPLYSPGKGPKIAVLDFEGENGAEFAVLLTEALKPGLKVYSRTALAAKSYETKTTTRLVARKIAAEIAVDYIVTGKVSKKSDTLLIISIYLRDGKTGDIRLTNNQNIRSAEELNSAAADAAEKIAAKTR